MLTLLESLRPVAAMAQSLLIAAAPILKPVLGIAIAIGLAILFRPLASGLWAALRVLAKPRQTLQQRITRHRFHGAIMLNRLASEHSLRQPNLAAELRAFAARD